MTTRTRYTCLTLVFVALVGPPAAARAEHSVTARAPVTIHPRIGIGPVRLGESKRSVERSLGRGRRQRRGVYSGLDAYRSGPITLEVSYDSSTNRVDGVDTPSRAARIYGMALSRGLARLRATFRSHHWRIASCRGETFTFLEPGGSGTGIAWRRGHLDDVQIDAGGSIGEQCIAP